MFINIFKGKRNNFNRNRKVVWVNVITKFLSAVKDNIKALYVYNYEYVQLAISNPERPFMQNTYGTYFIEIYH